MNKLAKSFLIVLLLFLALSLLFSAIEGNSSKTKEVSPYLWETTCEHNKNMRLAKG